MGPISIFLGLVIALVCFGIVLLVAGGLWALTFVLLRHRRRARSAVVIVGIVLALGLIGCFLFAVANIFHLDELIPVSERSMVGTYVVHYRTDDDRPAGSDTLILKPDHTFIQICLPEKGKQIEATIDRRPIKKYDRVRMTGTWHIVRRDWGYGLELEGALGAPGDFHVLEGHQYTRVTSECIGGLPIRWGAILARGDSDTDNADYFEKVK